MTTCVSQPSVLKVSNGAFTCIFMMYLLFAFGSAALADDDLVSGENLIRNASFENIKNDQPVDWKTSTWSGQPKFEIETEFGHTGKSCVKISSSEGADASWSYKLSVKPNEEYELSAWIKTDKLDGGGLGSQLNFHELQMEGKTDPIRGTKDWTRVTSRFHSGPRSELLLNCLYGGWGHSTGTVWFDDVSVVMVRPEPVKLTMSKDEAGVFFEDKVLPVLQKNCFECHGGEKTKAELVLTNRDDMVAGGESGAAIKLDDLAESLLLSAINYDAFEMPPSGMLSKTEIADITTWVHHGAIWKGAQIKPAPVVESHSVPQVNTETKKWWSFNKPKPVPSPQTKSAWVSNEIDEFILTRLQANELSPNPRASKQTLIRRAYYDLTGLPPTPAEVNQFLGDHASDAYEVMIDRLLDSKHYGEKWGRHWLDLVRYAESNSYERDSTKPFVWRYRDYVIKSHNEDKPFDQFVIEQLAGDELERMTPDSLIATGYYRLGIWDDEPVDKNQAWYDDMDDVLATTSQAFLGITVNCARCHDHKIDPIPQADYYKMLSFFRNVQRYGVRGHDTVLRQSTRPIESQSKQDQFNSETKAHRDAIQANRNSMAEVEKLVKTNFIPVEHEEFRHENNRVRLVKQRVGVTIGEQVFTIADAEKYEQLFEEMKRLRQQPPKEMERALCVTENGSDAPKTHVMIRGNANSPGDEVQPGFPSVLSPPDAEITVPSNKKTTGRRLALAKWIASPDNPLTARVFVNRIWQHHFGRGIVRSSNDFGFQGIKPSHPELLDWLANEFVSGGWKMKKFHKMLMMSSTYQMSSAPNEASTKVDPTNNLFWRFDMRRLTAEEIRDSILAVNGTLNRNKMFGPSIFPTIEKEILHGQSQPGSNWGRSSPEDITRRSVYIHIKRSLPVPMMQSFDVADTDSSCPVRFNTVQPTQALGMINSVFVNEQAAIFAEIVKKHAPENLNEQIEFALKQVLQRNPTSAEIQRGAQFVETQSQLKTEKVDPLKLFCVIALNLNEFMYLD